MKEYLEIKVLHVVAVLLVLFTIYVFTTGWGCGLIGKCNNGQDMWQGIARFIICIIMIGIVISFIMFAIMEDLSFTIKNPFYSEKDMKKSPAWEEYQQWLKERRNK